MAHFAPSHYAFRQVATHETTNNTGRLLCCLSVHDCHKFIKVGPSKQRFVAALL